MSMKKKYYLSVLCLIFLIGCVKTQPMPGISETSSHSLLSETATSLQSEIFSENKNEHVNDEYKYKIENNGVTITEYIGNASELTIPDTIDGVKVKKIGTNAFWGNQTLKRVILSEYCEVIETCAFMYSGIYKIVIPDSATDISSAAFNDCLRELVLIYNNNPLFPQYGIDNNVLCAKANEYNPVLPVKLVGGKPLNDNQNIGINPNDYNLVKRKSLNEYEYYGSNYFDFISFERYIYTGYISFFEGDDISKEAIKNKLAKTATLLYQCGINGFDPKTVNTGEVGCFDNLVLAAIYCRSPEQLGGDGFQGTDVRFVDDLILYFELEGIFDVVPDPSLITGYSQQQHGIWYYPKEFFEIKSEVLSFDGTLDKGLFTLKVKLTDHSSKTFEKIFTFALVHYNSVGGDNYRVILKSIK